MTLALKTIIYPVKDLAEAKTLFSTLLGQDPIMDEVYSPIHHDPGASPSQT